MKEEEEEEEGCTGAWLDVCLSVCVQLGLLKGVCRSKNPRKQEKSLLNL